MHITNNADGVRGFFHQDDPLMPVYIRPGETVEVRGFNPSAKSHAAQIQSGEISIPASDMRRWQAEEDKRLKAEEKAEAERQAQIARDEAAAEKAAAEAAAAAEKAAKAGQSPS